MRYVLAAAIAAALLLPVQFASAASPANASLQTSLDISAATKKPMKKKKRAPKVEYMRAVPAK